MCKLVTFEPFPKLAFSQAKAKTWLVRMDYLSWAYALVVIGGGVMGFMKAGKRYT